MTDKPIELSTCTNNLDRVVEQITSKNFGPDNVSVSTRFFTDEFKRATKVIQVVQRNIEERIYSGSIKAEDVEIRPYSKSDTDGYRIRCSMKITSPVVIVHGNACNDGITVVVGQLHKLDYAGQYFKKGEETARRSFEEDVPVGAIADFIMHHLIF